MIRETSRIQKIEYPMGDVLIQSDKLRKSQFPVLKLERVKAEREKHMKMLNALFPTPVNLKRLIHDIENSFSVEFASMIGSTDHAEARLAGLLSSLRELAEKIEMTGYTSLEEIEEYVRSDTRIHELFEDLVLACAKLSIEKVQS